MSEFGAIFDYQLSAMVFSFGTIGFMVAYAMAAMVATARVNERAAAVPQAA
jgi:hypothetical protein